MSIATEITRLNNAKASIKSAIENKGVTVPSSTKLDGYASLVSSIPGIVPTGTINITENGEVNVTQYETANVNVQAAALPPILSVTVIDSNNNITVSPVYDGIAQIIPIGQDIVLGDTYTFKVVAVGDVANHLASLKLEETAGGPPRDYNFEGATVESLTKDGVTYSTISKVITTSQGGYDTCYISFDGVRYTQWDAV